MIGNLRKLYRKMNDQKAKVIERERIKFEIKRSTIQIMTIDETLDYLEKGGSIARFGDGELDIILGKKIGFQSANAELGKALKDILVNDPKNCLIAVPDAISTLENLTQNSIDFWIPNMSKYRREWVDLLTKSHVPNYRYGNAHVSRCYIRYQDKSNSARWFERIMNIWKGKDVVVIEGEKTRLGCGNDFLRTAKSIRRILGPAENAFEKKDDILDYIVNNIEKSAVLILALGPTATILSYELAQLNYQALDLGHCDIEYEWYLMGVTEKVVIKGKYTNEVNGGKSVDEFIDKQYQDEIIERIFD